MIQKIHDFILIESISSISSIGDIVSNQVCINTNYIVEVIELPSDNAVISLSQIAMSNHRVYTIKGTPEDFYKSLMPIIIE